MYSTLDVTGAVKGIRSPGPILFHCLRKLKRSHLLSTQILTKDNHIIQLAQDPITTHWHERSILLPYLDVNELEVLEYNSYTSHFQLTNHNGQPIKDETLSITSTSPCSVYINDIYYILDPHV